MRILVLTLLFVLGTMLVPGVAVCAAPATVAAAESEPVRVVYHLDADSKGTTTALHQVRNQLQADPTAKIIIVAIGTSVRFLVKGSLTEGGYPFALMIEDLQQSGVRVEACGNTMTTLKIKRDALDDGIVVVPSGMAELARLQSRDHYAYIKP